MAVTKPFGLDYAWGRPSISTMKKRGVKFVMRYLSHDKTGKNLTRKEAELLTANGIWIGVVWESTSARMLNGFTAGQQDAREAAKQATTCGMPKTRPIYFACDIDATEHQQAAINDYLKGVISVIGIKRTGIYAGYHVVHRAYEAKLINWAWQTYAWSGGLWHPKAHVQQYDNGNKMDGVSVDYNHATRNDYGQWMVAKLPEETDMDPGTDVAIHPYWAKQKVFSHPEYDAGFLWQGAVAESRITRRELAAKIDAQTIVIEKLADALQNANPISDEALAIFKQELLNEISSIKISVEAESDNDN